MRLLLDAHTLIWAVDDPSRLGPEAMVTLAEPRNDLLLSAGTIWELGIKAGLGKLALSLDFREWIEQALKHLDAAALPITVEYVDTQRKLPRHHRDPFDRLLVAQAQVESIPPSREHSYCQRRSGPRQVQHSANLVVNTLALR